MFPEGWRHELLDLVAKRGTGHTPRKDRSEYWNGGIKWVSLADSCRLDRGLIVETDKEISAAGIENSSAVLHPAGTVVLSRDAGVGKSAVLATPMAVSQHFITWDCAAHPDLHNWYLYYWLQAEKPELERIAVGSTIKTIGLPHFKRMKIPLPPIDEQHRIARILATWDEAIAVSEKLLDSAKCHHQALVERLLIRPTRVGTWTTRRIDEIADRVQRRAEATSGLPVLMISSGTGFVRQDEKYSRYMAGKSVENYIALEAGEFAYNKGNSNRYEFGCVFALRDPPCGLVPHVYVCFKLRVGFDAEFYRQLFVADYLRDQLGALVNTGVRNNGLLNIRPGDFMKCMVPVPETEEQHRIAAVLSTAESWVEHHTSVILRLRKEKDVLMRQLLTGRRRVIRALVEKTP